MQAMGKLAVRVYTSQAQIPVEGATVVVTVPGDGEKMELIGIQVTDDSGTIIPMEIATPEVCESTSPNMSGDPQPFAVCNVWAEHPGYAMLQVEGVQIFPGVETVQEMELLPLIQGESSLQQRRVREIPPQGL